MLMPKNRFLWMLLAIQGGFINVAGLLSIHLFVSHVTGFSAHFSEALVSKNGEKVFYFLLVPFFFLCGSFFSALFTQVEKRARKTPRYLVVMITLAVIYFIIFIAGHLGAFGDFGRAFLKHEGFYITGFTCVLVWWAKCSLYALFKLNHSYNSFNRDYDRPWNRPLKIFYIKR